MSPAGSSGSLAGSGTSPAAGGNSQESDTSEGAVSGEHVLQCTNVAKNMSWELSRTAACKGPLHTLPAHNVLMVRAAGKARAPLRAGYLGHLTLVANRMAGAAGRRRTVKRFLDGSDAWTTFSEGALKVPRCCCW